MPIRLILLVILASGLFVSCKQAQITGTSENEALKVCLSTQLMKE